MFLGFGLQHNTLLAGQTTHMVSGGRRPRSPIRILLSRILKVRGIRVQVNGYASYKWFTACSFGAGLSSLADKIKNAYAAQVSRPIEHR